MRVDPANSACPREIATFSDTGHIGSCLVLRSAIIDESNHSFVDADGKHVRRGPSEARRTSECESQFVSAARAITTERPRPAEQGPTSSPDSPIQAGTSTVGSFVPCGRNLLSSFSLRKPKRTWTASAYWLPDDLPSRTQRRFKMGQALDRASCSTLISQDSCELSELNGRSGPNLCRYIR